MSENNEPSSGGRAVAILFLILQAVSVVVFGGLGLFVAFVSDSCGSSSTCDEGRIAAGMMTPLAVALLFFVISLVQTIRRMRAGKSVWWVPIVWTLLSASGVVLGFLVAISGVADNGSLL